MKHEHNLAIFRGRIKFKSNVQKIWGVLLLLSLVTIVEVTLGIMRPDILEHRLLRLRIINWIFITLTIVKAYYIMWDFMHLRDEKKGLKYAIMLPLIILIPYLSYILLYEGNCIFDTYAKGALSWNF